MSPRLIQAVLRITNNIGWGVSQELAQRCPLLRVDCSRQDVAKQLSVGAVGADPELQHFGPQCFELSNGAFVPLSSYFQKQTAVSMCDVLWSDHDDRYNRRPSNIPNTVKSDKQDRTCGAHFPKRSLIHTVPGLNKASVQWSGRCVID